MVDMAAGSHDEDFMVLRWHLGLDNNIEPASSRVSPDTARLFFIESTPAASRPAKCKLSSCRRPIEDEYRIVVDPGMETFRGKARPG